MIVLGSKTDTPTCEKLDTKSLKTSSFLFICIKLLAYFCLFCIKCLAEMHYGCSRIIKAEIVVLDSVHDSVLQLKKK